jgi:hypothetical protein
MKALWLSLFVLVMVAAGSSIAAPAPADTFDGLVKAHVRLDGADLPVVMGDTNLPNGTLLMVTVSRKAADYSAQDKAVVVNGQFHAGPFSLSGRPLNPGDYIIEVTSPMTVLQPTNVQEALGRDGARLRGPMTGKDALGGRAVKITAKVHVGGQSDLALDTEARTAFKRDLKEWEKQSCVDRCEFVGAYAATHKKVFDQKVCLSRCPASPSAMEK